MAKVTITFEDMEEGVSLLVESEPPLPEEIDEDTSNLTDAQQMALSMAMMFDQQMKSFEDEISEEKQSKGCCAKETGCGEQHKKQGECPKHKETPPEECCQH